MPFVPARTSSAAAEAAWPITVVDTSGLMYCMVSYMANSDVISPPGELIYRLMSFSSSLPMTVSSSAGRLCRG